jgi:hypothetical protein
LRVAGALEELPEMAAALDEARLPFSAVRELTRVATPATEAAWIQAATGRAMREIEPMVAGRRPGDLPETPPDPELIRHKLFLEVSAETFALARETFRLLRRQAGEYLSDDEVVAQMCRSVLGGPVEAGRASYQIALAVCPDCDKAQVQGGGDAVAVPATVLERARCDAQHLGRVDTDKPSRAKQDPPPAARRAVMLRDRGRCVVPGCRAARYLDVHHLRFRANGGDNRLSNLAVLCGAHHDQVHAGRLIIDGEAPHLEFFHADGRRYGWLPRWPWPERPMCAEAARPTWGRDADAWRSTALRATPGTPERTGPPPARVLRCPPPS